MSAETARICGADIGRTWPVEPQRAIRATALIAARLESNRPFPGAHEYRNALNVARWEALDLMEHG